MHLASGIRARRGQTDGYIQYEGATTILYERIFILKSRRRNGKWNIAHARVIPEFQQHPLYIHAW